MSKLDRQLPKKHKFNVRIKNRCKRLRPLARVLPQVRAVPSLLPRLALRGEIPGVIKASW